MNKIFLIFLSKNIMNNIFLTFLSKNIMNKIFLVFLSKNMMKNVVNMMKNIPQQCLTSRELRIQSQAIQDFAREEWLLDSERPPQMHAGGGRWSAPLVADGCWIVRKLWRRFARLSDQRHPCRSHNPPPDICINTCAPMHVAIRKLCQLFNTNTCYEKGERTW